MFSLNIRLLSSRILFHNLTLRLRARQQSGRIMYYKATSRHRMEHLPLFLRIPPFFHIVCCVLSVSRRIHPLKKVTEYNRDERGRVLAISELEIRVLAKVLVSRYSGARDDSVSRVCSLALV